MTPDKRRVLRMLCKALLLVSLPLAGFVWALPEDTMTMAAAALLSVVALVVGFGAEYLASSTENDIQELSGKIVADRQRRVEDLEQRDEKLRQFDRIVNLLTEQNHDLRSKLLAVQVDLQNRREALLRAAGEAIAGDDLALPTATPSIYARAN